MSGILITALKNEKKNNNSSKQTYHKYYSEYLNHFLTTKSRIKQNVDKNKLLTKIKTDNTVIVQKEKIQKVNTLINHFV